MVTRDLPTIRPMSVPDETHAQRAAGLLAHAKREASEHVRLTLQTMGDLTRMADEIATGGDAYPPGIREEARRMASELSLSADRVASIMAHSGRAR